MAVETVKVIDAIRRERVDVASAERGTRSAE
jgi:hypothetical protein